MWLEIRQLEELEVFDGLRLSIVVAAEALAELAVEVLAELAAEVLADVATDVTTEAVTGQED